ncbi:PVC-type heme-binding CxxCH protein [Planctomicrobium sp. SH664]|uniref:PVC-type heme-binding CxxCH protein n=1 Tax=Planctomicrobium sp. SH664 TaxID=3448125 RepID=UPI003F5AF07E
MAQIPGRWVFAAGLVLGVFAACDFLQAAEDLGVQVPEGFEVTLYADDHLAHDIYSMTIDSLGRVVVSGAGYVKILQDTNGDGVADVAIPFADGPRTGAQGMYFVGRDLLCAGDAGLIRFRDRDGNDRADGPPDVFLKIKAGNEHGVHAIRKGPDGWWYVIAGNHAGVTDKYISLPTSPVTQPVAGTLLRLSPDLSKGEVFAHGFRNAYDFDFNALGDVFSFDSDDERDISLPWYCENRVFHVLPGSHQGWISSSWKRRDYFFDMPPVVGSFGRGSPTGVASYQHRHFPAAYQGALFVLDWTYGRVLALKLKPEGSTWTSESTDFMTAVGQHGFAPTDVEVAPDGTLYIAVGGRGTRGGVYRVKAKDSQPVVWPPAELNLAALTNSQKLQLCLQAPQPLSSWARRVWEPLALQLNSEPFLQAAEDRSRPDAERIRAIEILTEKFNGLGGDAVLSLSADPSAAVRTRAVWSVGRTQPGTPNHRFIEPFLKDQSPFVVRAAMEALGGAQAEVFDELIASFGQQLAHPDRFVRQSAMRLLTLTSNTTFYKMAEVGFPAGWRAAMPVAAAYAARNSGYQQYPVEIALRVLKGKQDVGLKLEAARVLQLGLGDLTPPDGQLPAVFDGYAPRASLAEHEQQLDGLRIAISALYPSGDAQLDHELERIIAMIQPPNDRLLGEVLTRITSTSDPVDDIHHLIVASRIPAQPGPEQRQVIANAMIQLEVKIAERKLRQDTHWPDRIGELYQALVERDPRLPVAILEHPQFGLPGHVPYIPSMPEDSFDAVIAAFSRQIANDDDYVWNPDVVFLLAESPNPADRNLLRQKFSDYSLRSAVLLSLAERPEEQDRRLLIQGLDSAPLEVTQACIHALASLKPSTDPLENVMCVRALRKLGDKGEERLSRDMLVEMLRRNLKEDHGYILGRDGDPQQSAISAWIAAVQSRFPAEYALQSGEEAGSIAELKQQLEQVNWAAGDAARGQLIFQHRGCVQCHGSRTALGPDLTGVAGRFSRDDLFIAIAFPNQDVSPRYQTMQIVTKQGQVRTGLIVYESVDGLVLRDANNRTYRLESQDIEIKRPLSQSLMPGGLLKGLSPGDLADLNAFLRSLGTQTTAVRPPSGEPE